MCGLARAYDRASILQNRRSRHHPTLLYPRDFCVRCQQFQTSTTVFKASSSNVILSIKIFFIISGGKGDTRVQGASVRDKTPLEETLDYTPDFQQAHIVLYYPCFHNRIRVLLDDSLSFTGNTSHLSQPEQERLVDIHQLLVPELVFVKNICSEQLRRDTASQVFQPLPTGETRKPGSKESNCLVLTPRSPRKWQHNHRALWHKLSPAEGAKFHFDLCTGRSRALSSLIA